MIVLPNYPLIPNVCYHCRSNPTPCVDLIRDDDDNPNRVEHIYLCHKCLIHAARLIAPKVGHVILSADEAREQREQLADYKDRLIKANEDKDRALAARDAIMASYGPVVTSNPAPVAVTNAQRFAGPGQRLP